MPVLPVVGLMLARLCTIGEQRYRVGQFRTTLRKQVGPTSRFEASSLLSPALLLRVFSAPLRFCSASRARGDTPYAHSERGHPGGGGAG
mgnify:CR=1 FL=1